MINGFTIHMTTQPIQKHGYQFNMNAEPLDAKQDSPDNSDHIRRGWLLLLAIVVVLILTTWIFIHWDLDRLISSQFYTSEKGWYLRHAQPWSLIYKFGTIPGLLLTITALVFWVVCLTKSRLRYLHRMALVVVLTAVIGPGLLVNGVFKNYWGRPRPRQVEDFGGNWAYLNVSQPGVPGKGKSFPCGHCSMGFLICSLVVFRRHAPWLAYGGGILGVSLGAFISLTRIVQGAHFPTDTIWSLGIVSLVTTALYYLILQVPKPRQISAQRMSRSRKWLIGTVTTGAALAIIIGFMLHRPFYQTHVGDLKLTAQPVKIVVNTNERVEKINTIYSATEKPRIVMNAWGFAWLGVKHHCSPQVHLKGSILYIDLAVAKKGYFAELTHELRLYLPKAIEHTVTVTLNSQQS